jgi:8-oxo-dGTP pyrophosphatase MutT (NUDIX family)
VDLGELPSAAARRELREEAGLCTSGRALERLVYRSDGLTFYTYVFSSSTRWTPTLNEESTANEWARIRGMARRNDLHPGLKQAILRSKFLARFL